MTEVTVRENLASGRPSVVVFGTGNVGSDLLMKLSRSSRLAVGAVIGRRADSPGVLLARERGFLVLTAGAESLGEFLATNRVRWVIDASSTAVNQAVLEIAQAHSVRVLDLTPSAESTPFLPGVSDIAQFVDHSHVGLVSCGAQASFPVLSVLTELGRLKRIELTSSLASDSVGPGTRSNIDAYIDKTSDALLQISDESKVILIINPATPPIDMSFSLFLQFRDYSVTPLAAATALARRWPEVLELVPGLSMVASPKWMGDHIQISFKVEGAGDFLPKYAGNLDVITRAAVSFLEEFAGRDD
jgi:acetaldehyde dehydrogenase (acetylating)